MKNPGLSLLAYILLGLFIAIAVFALSDWNKFYLLNTKGMKATGRITEKEPLNHHALRYSYVVEGQVLNGVETLGERSVGINFNIVNVGDSVEIVYLPDRPQVSCLCNPRALLETETLFIALPALLVPIVIFIVDRIRRKRRS